MNRSLLRRLMTCGFEDLYAALTTQQYLKPHEPLSAALSRMATTHGVCPGAVDQAVVWLQIDPATSIGRLRRTELMQLAQSIYRFWEQRVAIAAEPSQRSS